MKVKAVKWFEDIRNGQKVVVAKGAMFDLDPGDPWLQDRLVVPVREKKIETSVREPQERAITR